MTYGQKIDAVEQIAGDNRPGWNKRYRNGLALMGLTLVQVPRGVTIKGYYINAPYPMDGDPEPWPMPSIIVECEHDGRRLWQ